METNNKVALITGANKGIGLEIARELGNQGITVIVGARDAGRGQQAAEALRQDGIDAQPIALDVLDEASIKKAAESIEQQFGHLDILVNNAGISRERGQKPSESSAEYLRETYATNVIGVVSVTNALLPLLRKSPAGRSSTSPAAWDPWGWPLIPSPHSQDSTSSPTTRQRRR